MERLARMQRQYHRGHPWRLSTGGVYVPHCYKESDPEGLSWWDDVGFILNGRRVIVWWQHPRYLYANAIETMALDQAGPSPDISHPFGSLGEMQKNYVAAGASRKKLVSYTWPGFSEERRDYYDRVNDLNKQLSDEGIDQVFRPSWKVERLDWALGMSLVAPIEVRSDSEAIGLAGLARRLMKRETSIDNEFSSYAYTREDWLRERGKMNTETRSIAFVK